MRMLFSFILLMFVTSSWAAFPQGFRWCVASSGHQIEGNNVASDWWPFERLPGTIRNNDRADVACDHWNRVDEDVRLLKDLHVSTYRFSVEWAKIEPSEGEYDETAIQHYRAEVESLLDAGIAPMITLQHFVFPNWVRQHGGFEWPNLPSSFSRFAAIVYSRIAPECRDWITINEPMVTLGAGYIEGVTPPQEHRDLQGLKTPIMGVLKAHAAAYHTLKGIARSKGLEVRVGMAHHLRTYRPARIWSPVDQLLAHSADALMNWAIADALESGVLQIHVPFIFKVKESIPNLAGTQDFVGVNYYTGDRIRFTGAPTWFKRLPLGHYPKSDVGWDIHPEGLYDVLMTAKRRYPGRPIIITENGIADASDAQRPDFIRNHLQQVERAIDKGAPVEGYCHWTLMDNFEWIDGYMPRFGLYEMNYVTLERRPRASARLYSDIALKNSL